MLFNLLQNQDLQNWLDEHGLYWVVRLMFYLEFRAFLSVVLGFVIVLLFGKRVIRWLIAQKVGDAPEFYNKDLNKLMAGKAATPTMGGILICASILITILLFADMRNFLVRLAILVMIWLAALGGIDDWLKLTARRRAPNAREGLFAWEKLLFQLGIGVIAGIFLYMHGDNAVAHVLNLPFQRTYVPGSDPVVLEDNLIHLSAVAYVILATMLIAATSNAVNLTDGMDGLASGTMVIASFTLFALAYIAGVYEVSKVLLVPHIEDADEMMIIAGAMAGACLGFLWWNASPALVFMGDTGSLPLGGLLAYIAVAIRQEVLLLIIGGVFFLEMMSVMMQVAYFRATGGKRIFLCSPIHHHFQLKGWSEQQVVTRFWVLGVIFAMIALVSIKLR
jgi:phospho-N-acetylmuramoyl-pentapeptide-transferase